MSVRSTHCRCCRCLKSSGARMCVCSALKCFVCAHISPNRCGWEIVCAINTNIRDEGVGGVSHSGHIIIGRSVKRLDSSSAHFFSSNFSCTKQEIRSHRRRRFPHTPPFRYAVERSSCTRVRRFITCIHLTYFLSSQLLWVSAKNEVNMTSHKNLFTVELPLFE